PTCPRRSRCSSAGPARSRTSSSTRASGSPRRSRRGPPPSSRTASSSAPARSRRRPRAPARCGSSWPRCGARSTHLRRSRAIFGRMRALAVAALALVLVPSASADILGTAQVRDSAGKLVAAARGGAFSYPEGGGLVSIARVRANGNRVRLDDVSMLGGRIHADRVTLRRGQAPLIENLVVDGLLRDTTPNSLFSLDTSSYLVVSQKAVIGKTSGVVGLRLSVAPGYPGAPGGAQVLVGLRERGAPARAQLASKVVTASGPW